MNVFVYSWPKIKISRKPEKKQKEIQQDALGKINRKKKKVKEKKRKFTNKLRRRWKDGWSRHTWICDKFMRIRRERNVGDEWPYEGGFILMFLGRLRVEKKLKEGGERGACGSLVRIVNTCFKVGCILNISTDIDTVSSNFEIIFFCRTVLI